MASGLAEELTDELREHSLYASGGVWPRPRGTNLMALASLKSSQMSSGSTRFMPLATSGLVRAELT